MIPATKEWDTEKTYISHREKYRKPANSNKEARALLGKMDTFRALHISAHTYSGAAKLWNSRLVIHK